ncbi:hypothetical protein [Ligilactobacillus cholophilus]|uniref:hypothetical protein n=1 Tax=Ligilactobacillus cholophilus TaxID=3050131 RepID=UPI0025B1E35B|nr:hypothetical protein [Ligilactobacillus cholophilus]
MRSDVKMIKSILNKYIKLKKDLQEFTVLSSPLIGSMGSKSKKNNVESKILQHADYELTISKIEKAIQSVSDDRLKFILNNYIINKQYSVSEMCEKLSTSKSNFNYLKNKALKEFYTLYAG